MENITYATKTNIRVLGWLYIIPGSLGLLLSLSVSGLLIPIGLFVADRQATPILLLVSLGVAMFSFILCIPGIWVGVGLIRFRPWARVLGLVLGVLNLANFPIGTVIGIYALVSLLTPEASILFAES